MAHSPCTPKTLFCILWGRVCRSVLYLPHAAAKHGPPGTRERLQHRVEQKAHNTPGSHSEAGAAWQGPTVTGSRGREGCMQHLGCPVACLRWSRLQGLLRLQTP